MSISIRSKGLQMIPYNSRAEWLKIRKGYIGGSDAGAIVGLNPYASAFSVWAEKTGKLPEFEGNISTRVGNELEALVAKLFAEETGKQVQRCNFTLVNDKYPWACANIDRDVVSEDAILEIKTTTSIPNIQKFKNGEYPDQWYAQMTHYLAVTGCKKAYLAALENNRNLRIFELERDDSECEALMQAEMDFWETYIIPDKAPPADGHSATTSAIKAIFTEDAGDTVDMTTFSGELQQRKSATEQIKNLKSIVDGIDNRMKLAMGSNIKGTCGAFTMSWKLQKTSALDRDRIKADYPDIDLSKYTTEARVFRVTEKKGKTA